MIMLSALLLFATLIALDIVFPDIHLTPIGGIGLVMLSFVIDAWWQSVGVALLVALTFGYVDFSPWLGSRISVRSFPIDTAVIALEFVALVVIVQCFKGLLRESSARGSALERPVGLIDFHRSRDGRDDLAEGEQALPVLVEPAGASGLPEADENRLRRAMELAAQAEQSGDVPIGAILVVEGQIFEAKNEKELRPDPTAHAEMLVLRAAAQKLGRWRLRGATLYVTKEPCVMCAGAMVAARIDRLVFGCRDPKGGAAGSVLDILGHGDLNHRVAVTSGVLAEATASQLREFFARRR